MSPITWRIKILKDVLNSNQSMGTINRRYNARSSDYKNALNWLVNHGWIVKRICKIDPENPACRECFEFTRIPKRGRPKKQRKKRGRPTQYCLRFNWKKLHKMSQDKEVFPILLNSDKVMNYIVSQYQHVLTGNSVKDFVEWLQTSPTFFRWMTHPDRSRVEELIRELGHVIVFYDEFLGYRDTPWDPEVHPELRRAQTIEKLRLLYAISLAVDKMEKEGRVGGALFGLTMLEYESKYYIVAYLIKLIEIYNEVEFLARILKREYLLQNLKEELTSLRDRVTIIGAIIDKDERHKYLERVEKLHEKLRQLRESLRKIVEERLC